MIHRQLTDMQAGTKLGGGGTGNSVAQTFPITHRNPRTGMTQAHTHTPTHRHRDAHADTGNHIPTFTSTSKREERQGSEEKSHLNARK